jgi:transposase
VDTKVETKIKTARARGDSFRKIAADFDVSLGMVQRVLAAA